MDEISTDISTPFHDTLEEIMLSGKQVEIVFRNNGSRSVIRGKIQSLYNRDNAGYLKLTSGLEIGLNTLLEVDGRTPSNVC